MGLDPRIQHLDETTPFDTLNALDETIQLARKAFAVHVARTSIGDATADDTETFFVLALADLWSAREHVVASIEVDRG